jgi:allantoinase
VTTIVDMPLNSIPATTTVAALAAKRAAAAGQCRIDVGFWGGVVPGNVAELEPLARAGVRGFKCFMVPSGVDEFAHVSEADLAVATPVIARLGLPLLVPCRAAGADRSRRVDARRARSATARVVAGVATAGSGGRGIRAVIALAEL